MILERGRLLLRVSDLTDQLRLLDEMRVLILFKSIEHHRARLIKNYFPEVPSKKLNRISEVYKIFPFLENLFGKNHIDELRLINDCIKHSGNVSVGLSVLNSGWHVGKNLHDEDHFDKGSGKHPRKWAYSRIAPTIGAYWNNFVHSLKEEPEIKGLQLEITAIELLEALSPKNTLERY